MKTPTNPHNTRGASRKARPLEVSPPPKAPTTSLRLTSSEFDEQLQLVAASGLLVPEDERIFQEELRSIAEDGFPEGGVPFRKFDPTTYVVENYCSVCFAPLGPHNPRQLCRKTYCENADFVFDFCNDS